VGIGGRSPWIALAVAGHLLAAVAYLLLPWAAGNGTLAGRDFTGRELARLAHNLDVLLPPSAGAAALLPGLALQLVPAVAVAGALLAGVARLSSHPTIALRLSAAAGALAALVSLVAGALLLAGPAAGDVLSRTPRVGLVLALLGSALAAAGGWTAARRH